VSAVCPDYERKNGAFTYKKLNSGLPFTAEQHLVVVAGIAQQLREQGIELSYVITLADTEFDLPLVVNALADGDSTEFLRRCQESCAALTTAASVREIPLVSCKRFTTAFPDWFTHYERALAHMRAQALTDQSIGWDLTSSAMARRPLYKAMASVDVGEEYCREMVLRQWAQYATWGECATRRFGSDLVMINHSTPNLTRINDPLFRAGRERIPIIQLSITTMPS
jgi:hypothetical protein